MTNILFGSIFFVVVVMIICIRIRRIREDLNYWQGRTRKLEERFSALDKYLKIFYSTGNHYEGKK
jgi:hypothetical protein